jgi:hypothetical protein
LPGGLTEAVAVPLDNPHPAGVVVTPTVKVAGISSTVAVASFEQFVPGIVTVTVYVPALTPDN